ncbi:MAG: hypothetical protein JOZ18_17200, partial [Chloroflexi bacterium]|nr:hypothetical protein [Chloroflexota bacterium]
EICTYNNSQPNNAPWDIEWSADSKLIASVTDKGCTVWNANRGAIVALRYTQYRDFIAWHPQRPYIASLRHSVTDNSDSEQAYIWDATTAKKLIQLNSNVFDEAAWSPDGMRLAISTEDQAVQIWQVWQ